MLFLIEFRINLNVIIHAPGTRQPPLEICDCRVTIIAKTTRAVDIKLKKKKNRHCATLDLEIRLYATDKIREAVRSFRSPG